MVECKSIKFNIDYRKFGKWNTRTPKETHEKRTETHDEEGD